MGQFLCRVADADGRVFSHVEPASSLDEARQKLVDRGLFVYSVESRGGRLVDLVRRKSGRQVGGSEFLILNQQFNTLIKAGLPILKSLDLLATRASSPKLRPVIAQIRDRVREGKSLSEAVTEAGVFSKVYSTAILAGEKSGNLSGVLEYYIAYQKVSTGVRKKIIATLVYPALLIVMATVIVSYLVTAVIPKFAMLYQDLNVKLPGPTRLRSPQFPLAGNRQHPPEISDGPVFPHSGNLVDRRNAPRGRIANRVRRNLQPPGARSRRGSNPDGSRRGIPPPRFGLQASDPR